MSDPTTTDPQSCRHSSGYQWDPEAKVERCVECRVDTISLEDWLDSEHNPHAGLTRGTDGWPLCSYCEEPWPCPVQVVRTQLAEQATQLRDLQSRIEHDGEDWNRLNDQLREAQNERDALREAVKDAIGDGPHWDERCGPFYDEYCVCSLGALWKAAGFQPTLPQADTAPREGQEDDYELGKRVLSQADYDAGLDA